MTIFGRNQPSPGEYTPRFASLVDLDGNVAVYDAVTGRYAPGLDGDAATDLNADADDPTRYHWTDTIS